MATAVEVLLTLPWRQPSRYC